MAFRGALLPPVAAEEFVPFVDGEDPWRLAGAEVPKDCAEAMERVEGAAARGKKGPSRD